MRAREAEYFVIALIAASVLFAAGCGDSEGSKTGAADPSGRAAFRAGLRGKSAIQVVRLRGDCVKADDWKGVYRCYNRNSRAFMDELAEKKGYADAVEMLAAAYKGVYRSMPPSIPPIQDVFVSIVEREPDRYEYRETDQRRATSEFVAFVDKDKPDAPLDQYMLHKEEDVWGIHLSPRDRVRLEKRTPPK